MFTFPAPLAEIRGYLRSGQIDLRTYIVEVCDRIDRVDRHVHALLPEPGRRERLLQEAATLQRRFPDPAQRPSLYGVLVGVKDMFHVEGLPTRAGSQLPPALFAGPEAASVAALRAAGALILGKTVTTEFAYFEPGPTRNPHNLDHTPGGSSSGSAAAVAAGLCPLALGTQTVGSVIRPAAFCGIVGFKPGYGRISTNGVIAFSVSTDHVGLFTQDVAGMTLAAALLCRDWQPAAVQSGALPILGVPEGPYLDQAAPEALTAFAEQVMRLEQAGFTVRRVAAFADIAAITRRHRQMIAAEMARVHTVWFAQHESLYRPRTAAIIREGQDVNDSELAAARAGRAALRTELTELMFQAGVDIWISPAATGPAPVGIDATGDPALNLPWTHAGLPTITLPAGRTANGLPLGLQAAALTDERLLAWSALLEHAL